MSSTTNLEHYYKQLNEIGNVSRETFDLCSLYINTLLKWNKRINLVSKKHHTFDDIWERHFIDSAQIIKHIPTDAKIITDLGSGGGFPGIVIGILTNCEVHLIESDSRKCAFLNEVARHVKKGIHIHNERIEKITSWKTDVITARALSSLDKLLELSNIFEDENKLCLFLKGENVVEEINEANENWNFNYTKHKSLSSSTGCILEITNLKS